MDITTSLILLEMLTMLPSLYLISRRCPPINAFAAILDTYRGQRQISKTWVGADEPPSTILIDDVPVEGVEVFNYRCSKQNSNGYCRLDVLRRIGLACSVMNSPQMIWNCSSFSISTKVQSTDKVCSALRYRNIDPIGGRHE